MLLCKHREYEHWKIVRRSKWMPFEFLQSSEIIATKWFDHQKRSLAATPRCTWHTAGVSLLNMLWLAEDAQLPCLWGFLSRTSGTVDGNVCIDPYRRCRCHISRSAVFLLVAHSWLCVVCPVSLWNTCRGVAGVRRLPASDMYCRWRSTAKNINLTVTSFWIQISDWSESCSNWLIVFRSTAFVHLILL